MFNAQFTRVLHKGNEQQRLKKRLKKATRKKKKNCPNGTDKP